MKTLSALVAILFTVSFYIAGFAQNNETPYEVKQFSLSSGSEVTVETVGGNIEVKGGQAGQAKVEMYVRNPQWKRKLSDADIKERLTNYQVDISQSGNKLNIKVTPKSNNMDWEDEGLSISFKLFVPTQVQTKLEATGGNISLADVTGRQSVKTTGGNISLDDINGDADVDCTGGNIGVEQYKGKIAISCSGGNINIDDANGEFQVQTAGGNLHFDNVSGSVKGQTAGGNISANIKELGKYLTLTTSGGNINADFPTNKGLDYDIKADRINARVENFNGFHDTDRIQGKTNGGGIPVKMSTSGGNIRMN
jgi:DUF4097 and DUF4098 domain-containing protein YvlB